MQLQDVGKISMMPMPCGKKLNISYRGPRFSNAVEPDCLLLVFGYRRNLSDRAEGAEAKALRVEFCRDGPLKWIKYCLVPG